MSKREPPSTKKPAPPRVWALLDKLQALVDRGTEGEKISALDKLERLRARYDFGGQGKTEEEPDLFKGKFQPSDKARHVHTFTRDEFDVANSVKWALENATKIPCVFRDGELLAEATAPTARRLGEIARHISLSFHTLLAEFSSVAGVTPSDRAAFVMGLYDGMMNEARAVGQPLPGRVAPRKKRGGRKAAVATESGGLHVHPYTVAVGLGKQIRFAAPIDQIVAELVNVTRGHLAESSE